MQIEELEDCRVNPCLVASDTVVRKILTQRRGNLEWSTGLGEGLDLGSKDGWDLTRHREKGGRCARQIPTVKTVVLGVRQVANWSHQCSGNMLGY